MSHSIFRVAKVNSSVNTKGIQKHVQRENKNYENKDINPDLTHLNYDLINGENVQFKDKIEQIIDDGYTGKRKIRSDAIKHLDGIVTSDKEFFDTLPRSDQEQYFKDSLKFIEEEYGEKNVVYATIHLDEKTPHMHFGVVPLTQDGRLSAKEVVGNKKALSELQDRFNDFVNKKGYNLERGEKRTGREHLETQEFKVKTLNEKVVGLENEAQLLEKNINKLRDIDKKVTKLDEFDDKAKQGIFNKVTMSKSDYEAFKHVAKSGIATLEKYEDLKVTNAEMIQELTSRNKELEKEQDYFMDRNQQLFKDNRELRQENNELNKQNNSLKRELQRYKNFVKNFGEQVKMRMEKLAEKLQANELFDVFKQVVFEPSKNFSNNEYGKDRKQEQKELALEKDNEHEL